MKKYIALYAFLVATILIAYPLPSKAQAPISDPKEQKAEDGSFTLLPGDILQVTVWKEEGMDLEIAVLPDGTITFPLVGAVSVEGKTPLAAQEEIKKHLEPSIPDASVSITVKAPLGHKVSVLGEVQKPGDIVLTSRTDVMQALSQAGGLTPYADKSDIVVIRHMPDGKKQSIPYPYNKIANGKLLEKDYELKPGDVVLVSTAGLF